VADRVVFQSDKTELEDKTFLRQFKERCNDSSMDSADSVSIVLPVEGEIKELWLVIYEFYFRDKDDAFPTGISV
jgi:hypothetical protein